MRGQRIGSKSSQKSATYTSSVTVLSIRRHILPSALWEGRGLPIRWLTSARSGRHHHVAGFGLELATSSGRRSGRNGVE